MYYTRKYTRPPNSSFEEPINSTLVSKRFSFPYCDSLSKSRTVPTRLSNRNSVAIISQTHVSVNSSLNKTVLNHCEEPSIESNLKNSCLTSGNTRCDDQTPLLTSEVPSTSQDSSNHTTRQYSPNAILPISHSSNSHPLSSSTITNVFDKNHVSDTDKQPKTTNGKSHRRSSLIKSAQINSILTNSRRSSTYTQSSSDQTDVDQQCEIARLKPKRRPINSKESPRKNSLTITPTVPSYRKDFMQKIERFRFIDDSASSTTTVTSPVDNFDRITNGHSTCSHLISSAIEQFDDYVRSKYRTNDEIDSYIDRLNSDTLTNGSYSDLNILNSSNDAISNLRSPNHFQPVTTNPPSRRDEYLQAVRNSTSTIIPSSHSSTSQSPIARPTTITTNGHSRSMDFTGKSDLIRPVSLKSISSIYETSSSSLATITPSRSSNSVEFNDDSKPSGVLVDDDFLPMSSPVDDHFWDLSHFNQYSMKSSNTVRECFPDVGSSPVIEKKQFLFQPVSNRSVTNLDPFQSETSCDDEDDDERSSAVSEQQKFSIHQYQMKELQKPLVIQRSTISAPLQAFEKSFDHNLMVMPIKRLTLEPSNSDESLLEKFASSVNESISIPNPIHSPRLRPIVSSDTVLTKETIYEEDDTQESSLNENGSDESADNGEIDLLQEFEYSQQHDESTNSIVWNDTDRDIFIVQEDDFLSALVTTPIPSLSQQRPLPPSIMKIPNQKSIDNSDDLPAPNSTQMSMKPKVRFNLDPQYEREREWNKVNKLLGHSVEWTDEFEV